MRLVLQRVVLRSLTPRDAEAMFALTSDERVARYMRFDMHRELGQAEGLVSHYTESGHGFAVLERGTLSFIGVAALSRDEETEGNWILSIFFSPNCWGKGYAVETLQAVRAYARDMLEAASLSAYVCSPNLASRRVLEKCGFTVDRVLDVPDFPDGLFYYTCRL